MHLTENRRDFLRDILRVLAWGGAGIFLGVCAIIWLHTPPSTAQQIRPLLKELDNYYAKNGTYPDSCVNFASFSKLTNQFKIIVENGNDAPEDTDYDFTLLVNPDNYKVYFPVSGANPLNFVAWRYDSKTHYWRKSRI